ncbi:MAG: extracellular catalytic domain type 1 short-chain-length polyhydroxyalkanoate depolymerase [Burkholderiaceae bacterium]
MHLTKLLKQGVAASLMAGVSLSAFALTAGSGTWVKESNLFGLQDAQTYVPKNPSPATIGAGRALMITLHGCSQTASGNVINKMFNWEATAEQYGMVVVAPTVPSGTTSTRTYSGCWDWFGGNHSRTTRDEAILLKLVDAVKSRSNLDIDPNQIYITGLSSGGGLVVDIGCVAPDYFAGMGINAGPALYTAANAGVGSKAVVTAQNVSDTCTSIAGSYASSLKTQITSVVNGTSDSTVDPTHDQTNANGMKINYGATTSNGTFTDVQSTGETWRDGNGNTRVSWVQATGMGHAWPAGSGGSGGGLYVDYAHINYPAYVTKFFFDNNLRVNRGGGTTTTTSAGTTTTTAATTSSTTSTTTTAGATTTTTARATTTTTSTTTTTTAPATGNGTCFTSSNYTHALFGRAHVVYTNFHVAANGSNQDMGLYSLFVTTTLKQIGLNNYIIGTCP